MSETTPQSFTQVPVTEELVPLWLQTSTAAFYAHPEPFLKLFFPLGPTHPALLQYRIAENAHVLATDPDSYYFLIKDKSTDDVVGVTRWRIYGPPSTSDQETSAKSASVAVPSSDPTPKPPAKVVNVEMLDKFRAAQASYKSKHLLDSNLPYYPKQG